MSPADAPGKILLMKYKGYISGLLDKNPAGFIICQTGMHAEGKSFEDRVDP
jgi:hypothetical protein